MENLNKLLKGYFNKDFKDAVNKSGVRNINQTVRNGMKKEAMDALQKAQDRAKGRKK